MRKFLLVLIFSFFGFGLIAGSNTRERAIHGFLLDSISKEPILSYVMVYTAKGKYVKSTNCDERGQFYLVLNETGRYKLTHTVSECKTVTVLLEITESTPDVQDLYFYSRSGDPNCIVKEHALETEFFPVASLSCGWRPMAELNGAIRFRPGGYIFARSHSVLPGFEWNFGFQKPLVGVKFGYTFLHECFDFSGYTIGCSGVYFFDRDGGGWYLQPRLGFEVLEVFDLFCQYNHPMSSSGIDPRINKLSFGLRMWMIN
jgi:hypothetical protein